jgi:hypothetical protein
MIHEPADGKYWNVSRSSDTSAVTNALVTLLSFDEEGAIELLGTAFVVYNNRDKAICVGASHSFEPPMRRSKFRSAKRELIHLPDLQSEIIREFKADEIFALVIRNGQPFVCKIISHNSLDGYDVVVFTAVESKGNDVFNWHVALDFKVPSVGDEVAAFTYKVATNYIEPGMSEIGFDLHLRHGFVTEAVWEPDQGNTMSGQSFVVRTTIPMEGGMSGSPMIWIDNESESCAAWGVVSSDRSKDKSRTRFDVAGDSAASMLWPAMGLSLEVSIEAGDEGKYTLLGQMLKMGVFDDRTDKVSVDAYGNSEKIEVCYTDSHSEPAQNYLLTTKGHPYLR